MAPPPPPFNPRIALGFMVSMGVLILSFLWLARQIPTLAFGLGLVTLIAVAVATIIADAWLEEAHKREEELRRNRYKREAQQALEAELKSIADRERQQAEIRETQRLQREALLLEQQAAAQRQREEMLAKAKRLEDERLRREAELREAEIQEKNARDEQARIEREAFLRAERHKRCLTDKFIFPYCCDLCPKCRSTNFEEILAGEPRFGAFRHNSANDFKRQFEDRMEVLDHKGVGNLIFDALMRPDQHKTPDEISTYVAEVVPEYVSRSFNLPATVSFQLIHTDRHIDPCHRGGWAEDSFPQLCVFAYVLGSTWERLPSPHAGLVPYFTWCALMQSTEILKVATEWLKTQPSDRSNCDLSDL